MGILGDMGEFDGLLCSCCPAAHFGRVVIDLVVWGGAGGVRGERPGANAAVILHSGQQVKLRLRGLLTGDNNVLLEPTHYIKRSIIRLNV